MQYIPFDKGVNNLYIRISMPIIKSAKKRVKIAAKAKARNVRTKRTLREALKAFAKAVDVGKAADIQKAQAEAISALDTAAKKAVIHKNKAARQKAALSAQAKAAGAKPVKATAKKAPAKPAAKPKKATKAPAKKPAAKKTSPKK
jgi:small subunit ribosomal protein S20